MTQHHLHLDDHEAWCRLGGQHPAEEIRHQPQLWLARARQVQEQQTRIDTFLDDWLSRPGHRVILTGAGSSAYVGEIAAEALNAAWPAQIQAIPSTSLLTHPTLYLDPARPTLLVSFARSGSSPESLAAVELLRQRVPGARFLNITCNAAGGLMRDSEGRADTLNLLMPAGSCDRGFAMTSSFSSMLLAALAALGEAPWAQRLQRIEQLAEAAAGALAAWGPVAAELAREPFERIVYLGSGPLEALAKEAALKVLELTSGRALALANTPLGFRHGPKSALNPQTLVLLLRSGDATARRYEQDLLDELRRDQVAGRVLAVGPGETLDAPALDLPDAWAAPLPLLLAQLFALHRSAALGLTPDNPFPDGTVNRVVQGVTIYRHEQQA
ncbi:SIS domain-containing protein [Paucibacter sp. XJ19-41]|uniref:SIS domain-containing protein n=1 Tax=Paucibacter sp. XJ19-41 TaxID=2927824 RepID=UPI00234A4238|nr:SIS domain-containing protein [Paucibacter sp. XJ19-41]MDC6166966.1 SIS domain-containing protein [Paucibacter sp. XJ19-41]